MTHFNALSLNVLLLLLIGSLVGCAPKSGSDDSDGNHDGKAKQVGAPIFESKHPNKPRRDDSAPDAATEGVFFAALPSDVPAIGRSLFDYRMARRDGDDWEIEVPYPFEELSKKLFNEGPARSFGALTVRRNSALIPRGRSLQRHANADDRFAMPRVIIGFTRQFATLEPVPENEQVGTVLGGRLYVAYSEPAKQLEIISYNEALGRFEFQVVHDYAPPPAVPKLRYARRSLCISCHQNEGPIFSDALWAETNDNPAIAMLIERAQAGATSYHGVPIGVEQSPTVLPLDESIRQANLILPHQIAWRDGCTGERDEAIRCRGAILKDAFGYVWNRLDQRHTPSNWTTDWEALANTALRPTSRIPDLEELENPDAFGGPRTRRADTTEAQVERVRDLVLNAPEPTDSFDPLTRRTSRDLENNLSVASQFLSGRGGGFGKLVVFTGNAIESVAHQTIHETSGRDLGRVRAAIDAVVQKTIDGDTDVLDGRPFSPGNVAQAIMLELDPDWRHQFCCGEEAPPLPAAVMDESTDAHGADAALAPFKRFCAECHSGAGDLGFLAGDDAAVMAQLSAKADLIVARLKWDQAGVAAMPPAGSSQHAELSKPEHAGTRLKMIVTLAN